MTRNPQRGVSLVETAATLTTLSILLASVVPGYQTFLDKRRVEGLAAEIGVDLQWARSEAVTRQQNVRIAFGSTPVGGRACYVIHTGPVGECACADEGPAVCSAEAQELKSMLAPADGRTVFRSNVGTMTYEFNRGTTTPGGRIDLTGAGGHSVRHVVSMLGRVTTCTPDGSMTDRPRCR
jgi:type IV fimbrial biogenesis protein FimT